MGKVLDKDFFVGSTEEITQKLLGKLLCRSIGTRAWKGKITEAESYLGEKDLAAHASHGRTKRTETMYGPPGHAYIYLIYGMYNCLNVVTQEEGVAEAVLIRALEPVMLDCEKIIPEQAVHNGRRIDKILNGPGKLCREFKIDKALNGVAFSRKNGLWLEEYEDISPERIVRAKRIGVEYARHWKDKPLRFYIKDSPFVSKR